MVSTWIARIRNADGSQTLKKRSDVSTMPYSEVNLAIMLLGVDNPLFVLKRIDDNGTVQGSTYPFAFQARNETEFKTANFDTVWNLLLSNPDQPFGKL